MCPAVENPNLVFQATGDSQGPAECGSIQTIQARPDHPDIVVSPFRGFSIGMFQGLISQRDLSPDLGLNLRLWS